MPRSPPVLRARMSGGGAGDVDYDRRRRRVAWRGWYKLAVWQAIRRDQLAAHPLCGMCADEGRVTVATVYVVPGRDIFCGLFSSGAIPSTSIFDANCVYYRVDYQ